MTRMTRTMPRTRPRRSRRWPAPCASRCRPPPCTPAPSIPLAPLAHPRLSTLPPPPPPPPTTTSPPSSSLSHPALPHPPLPHSPLSPPTFSSHSITATAHPRHSQSPPRPGTHHHPRARGANTPVHTTQLTPTPHHEITAAAIAASKHPHIHLNLVRFAPCGAHFQSRSKRRGFFSCVSCIAKLL